MKRFTPMMLTRAWRCWRGISKMRTMGITVTGNGRSSERKEFLSRVFVIFPIRHIPNEKLIRGKMNQVNRFDSVGVVGPAFYLRSAAYPGVVAHARHRARKKGENPKSHRIPPPYPICLG